MSMISRVVRPSVAAPLDNELAALLGGGGSESNAAQSRAFESELEGDYPREQSRRREPEDTADDGGEEDGYDDRDDRRGGREPDEGDPEDDDDDDEDEPEDDEPEDDDDEGDESEPLADDRTVTVRVNGEDQRVTLKELREGYSRTRDYTQKTEQLAHQRREVEQRAQESQQKIQQYDGQLQQMTEILQAWQGPKRSETDWQRLRDQDPEAYYQQREHDREMQERLSAVQKERERVEQERQQTQKAETQRRLAIERDLLMSALPEWTNDETRQRDIRSIQSYGESVGFSGEELGAITDHRVLKVLRDAAQTQAVSKPRANGKKPKSSGKRARPMSSGAPKRSESSSTSRQRNASKRHSRERSVESAAAWFESNMD